METKEYYNTKGVALDMSGDFAAAQESYRKGLQLAAGDGLLLNNLALSHVLSRDYDKGIVILEDLVKKAGAKDKYRHNLALAYGLKGEDQKAFDILVDDLSAEKAKENLKYYKDLR